MGNLGMTESLIMALSILVLALPFALLVWVVRAVRALVRAQQEITERLTRIEGHLRNSDIGEPLT